MFISCVKSTLIYIFNVGLNCIMLKHGAKKVMKESTEIIYPSEVLIRST